MFVRGIVVHNQVHVEWFGYTGVQAAQKREKLLMPVVGLVLGEGRTGGDVERGESSGRAVADIVVRHALT